MTLHDILKQSTSTSDAGKLDKMKKALTAVFKQDEIARLLARLDREKITLSLCMHEINS